VEEARRVPVWDLEVVEDGGQGCHTPSPIASPSKSAATEKRSEAVDILDDAVSVTGHERRCRGKGRATELREGSREER
jgi:predicted metal-dependent hydrolase